MSPRVTPRNGPIAESAFWELMRSPTSTVGDPIALLGEVERRALSRATDGAGGYLVPTDFDTRVGTLRRARSIISTVAREIETDHGRTISLPLATAHGTSAWQAENAAAAAPSDETFAQRSISAFKATSSVVVSEELLEDALPDSRDS